MRSQATQPKAIESTPPVLALFATGSLAVLRIHDMTYSDVVSAIVKQLPSDIINLMLITPTDTKMFDIRKPPQAQIPKPLPDGAEIEEVDDQQDIQEKFIAEAEQGDQVEADNADAIADAQAAIQTADTPAARRKAMMDMRRAERAGTASACGRCRGAGQVQVAMPSGGVSTAACPLCQGKGAIQRYGARR